MLTQQGAAQDPTRLSQDGVSPPLSPFAAVGVQAAAERTATAEDGRFSSLQRLSGTASTSQQVCSVMAWELGSGISPVISLASTHVTEGALDSVRWQPDQAGAGCRNFLCIVPGTVFLLLHVRHDNRHVGRVSMRSMLSTC